MPNSETFVCLANSRKLSGRCVAGKITSGARIGNWVRPVSARPSHEISEEERRYADGSTPKLLDVVQVEFLSEQGIDHQQENALIDPNFYWVKTGHLSWEEAAALSERPASLWLNNHSSYSGQNDRVPEAMLHGIETSLAFIRVPNMSISVAAEGAAFGNNKKKVRGSFDFRSQRYALMITDPAIEDEYIAKGIGRYSIDEEILACISLAERHEGFAYKLIASIIRK